MPLRCNLADDAAVIPTALQKKTKNKRNPRIVELFFPFFLLFFFIFFSHHSVSGWSRKRISQQEPREKKRVSRRFPDLASSQVRAACEFISCRRRRRHMRTITNGTRAIQSKVGNHTLFFSNSSFSLTANLLKSL